MKRYFLGVDGGGTKTAAIVVCEDGRTSEGFSGSLDLFNESEKDFEAHLGEAVNGALKNMNLNLSDISHACFGIPALGDVEGIEEMVRPILNKFKVPSTLENDVRVALEGAFPLKDGIIVLAGTGAMVMGKKGDSVFRVDGWGEHAGDLGSAYFVGKLTLQRAFKEYDGREKVSGLVEMIKEFTSVSDIRNVLLKCKGANVRKYVSSFAKVACDAANKGIEAACEILDTAVNELVKSVNVAFEKMKTRKMSLACVGGMFKCSYVRRKFEEKVEKIGNFLIVQKEFEPHMGAAFMAAKAVLNREEMKIFYNTLKSGGIK